MKIKLSLVGLLLFLVTTAYSQFGSKQSFVPENWQLFQEASGDLNKDSVNDVAVIIESLEENTEGVKPRALLILLKNKNGEGYILNSRADHVILDGQSGGTMGDPFESMEIKKGVLIIKFSGGSREQWSTTHRYRLKDNAYYAVIGATYVSEEESVTRTYDYNMSNGNMVITVKDSRNKAANKTTNKTLKLLPISLADFQPDVVWALMGVTTYGIKKIQASPTEVGLGDCYHIFFGEQDFGNAELYTDQATMDLWRDITATDANDEAVINPKYKNKKFEITYMVQTALRCEPQGLDEYQVVIGFKLLN